MEPQNNEPTKEATDTLAERMLEYMNRDYELRKSYLEHNKQDLKQRKWKTRAVIVIFGLPLVFWVLMIADIIKARSIVGDYVALVRIDGVITPESPASAAKLVPAIKKAFEDADAKGVVLLINSPGGTPVQADIIYQAIMKYRKEYPDKKVVAVGEDMLTSGAYWIASSAEEIVVNRSTLTGSIGVIASGFGVDLRKFAEKYGLERRVQTAGLNKNRNDMFLPQKKEDLEKTKEVLTAMHNNFKRAVLEGRGDRVNGDKTIVFSGDYWTGDKAIEMGLVDKLGDLSQVLRKVFDVKMVADYSPKPTFYDNMKRAFSAEVVMENLVNFLSLGGQVQYRAM